MSIWSWCLVNDDNTLAKGWYQVGDYWYYFYSNGQMACKEWLNLNGVWFYVDETGKMVIGWQNIEGNDYYFEERSNGQKGVMYQNGSYNINNIMYTFNEKGILLYDENNLVSDRLISFVKEYEQFYSYKYDDGTGTITQGYGATGEEILLWGETITEEQASNELKECINSKYAKIIKNDLDNKTIILEQYQFDSLVSFAYNVGVSSLLKSTLYKYIVTGGRDSTTITEYFRMWNKCINEKTGNIEVCNGLDKRRIAESNIFNNNVYDSSH